MKIAFCDDQIIYYEDFSRILQQYLAERSFERSLPELQTEYYSSAEELLADIEAGRTFSGYFLDIQLASMDGFHLAAKIRERNDHVPVIIISNYDTYLREGYKIGLYRYLTKPVKKEDVYACLDYCINQEEDKKRTVAVKVQGKGGGIETVLIPADKVTHISYSDHVFKVFCDNDTAYAFSTRERFSDYVEKNFSSRVIQVGQNEAVNLEFIQTFSKERITLLDGTVVPVSRRYAKDTIKRIQEFFAGV